MEQFESIKKLLPPDDSPYRLAQELCRELKIPYTDFFPFIVSAISKCTANGCDSSFHFTPTEEDYELTQYACYLVVEQLGIQDIEYHKQVKNYFYTKDFPWRNIEKQKVDSWFYEPKWGPRRAKEREIWNVKRWINIGSETDGKWKYLRPVLVLKTIGHLCLVAPLTSKGKEWNHPAAHLYHKLTSVVFDDCESFVMLNQIKVIDKKRCIKNMKTVEVEEFKQIKKLLRDMYFPEDL